MTNPKTKKEFTEIELLEMISGDAGRLSKIEFAVWPDEEELSIYNKIDHIGVSANDIAKTLFTIKKLLITAVCFLIGILLFLLFK
ncbi:MAG: hypothetical protein AAB913_01220 [Patescibacteria group bacterium]